MDTFITDGRPNIVLIVADDMGFSDIGCFGGEIETPNVDGLASRGVRLTGFTNNAVCMSTRASLLTGLWAQQAGAGPDFRGCRAVRKGRWKIVTEGPPRLHVNVPITSGTGAWELYDLDSDRCETNDLSDRHPDTVRELEALWLDWSARCGRA